jgi:hypothetical protein
MIKVFPVLESLWPYFCTDGLLLADIWLWIIDLRGSLRQHASIWWVMRLHAPFESNWIKKAVMILCLENMRGVYFKPLLSRKTSPTFINWMIWLLSHPLSDSAVDVILMCLLFVKRRHELVHVSIWSWNQWADLECNNLNRDFENLFWNLMFVIQILYGCKISYHNGAIIIETQNFISTDLH